MTRLLDRRYLLPIVLATLGLLLLIRVVAGDRSVLLPDDLDVVLLIVLAGGAMVAAIHTMVQISMHYLRSLSVERTRREILAEHNRFLRRLDHELKNPLTALRAGLSALSLTTLDARQIEIVRAMETETLRLSRLVAEMRKLAELEAQPLSLQLVDIEAFVANIVEVELDRFDATQRVLTSHVDRTVGSWVVDEDLLALAVHNLLDNAFKYTQPTDSIRLDVSVHDELVIQVTDTGSGIPRRDLPYVWEELHRAEHIDQIPGTGVGLALVKAIVERHSGTVDIESEPGQGTVVSMRFPALPVA